MIRITI